MALTYDTLQTEIAAYLGRADLTALIPVFITDAEARMNRELRLKVMERREHLFTEPGQPIVLMPNETAPDWNVFLEMRDLRLDGDSLENLEFRVPDAMPEIRSAGKPQAYTIVGRDLMVYPTPDAEYWLEMIYYAEIPPLSSQRQSNEVLRIAPDLYRFGSLVQSAGYTRSTAPLDLWESLYLKASTGLTNSDESGRFTPNIGCQPRRTV
jgi:hypothetical protein